MLIVGHGTICLLDGADAVARSGGNAVAHTEIVAGLCGVKEDNIIRSLDDLDKFFLE